MVDGEARSAGVRQADRLAAGKSSREIASAVKELSSTIRVYMKEWLRDSRHPTRMGADYAAEKYEGRLHSGDIRVDEDDDGTFLLMTRRWNVHSEWKHVELANSIVKELVKAGADPADVEAVPRNSRREHLINSYGTMRLASK